MFKKVEALLMQRETNSKIFNQSSCSYQSKIVLFSIFNSGSISDIFSRHGVNPLGYLLGQVLNHDGEPY